MKGSTVNAYGSLIGLGAFCTFVCVNILNKYMFSTSAINTWHIAYWRGLFMFLLNIAVCKYNGVGCFDIKREYSTTLFFRCIFGSGGLILNTLQYNLLSLSKGQAIYYTYPIWTAINGWIFLGEKLTKYDIIGIASAFTGVLLLIFNRQTVQGAALHTESPYGVPVALSCAFIISIGDIFSRKLGNNVSCYITPAYLGLTLAIMTSCLLIFVDPSPAALADYSPRTIFVLGSIAVFSWISYLLLTKAYQLEKAARVAVLSYVQILFATTIDVIYFGNKLGFIDVVGCALIVSGNFLVLLLKCLGVIQS